MKSFTFPGATLALGIKPFWSCISQSFRFQVANTFLAFALFLPAVLAQTPCLPVPSLAAGSQTQICSGESASLILYNLAPGQEALWYDDAGLSNLLYQDAANLFQPAPTTTTSYYGVIYDNLNNCYSAPLMVQVVVNGSTVTISGRALTESGVGIENVSVTLTGPGFAPITTFTDNMGQYVFNGVPPNALYKIRASLDINPLNGVTTFDLVLASKHILGIEPLNSPFKIIAADVNSNGQVSVSDIVETRMLILGILTEFTRSPSWKFVPSDYVFPDPANPWSQEIPWGCRCVNAQCNSAGQDFIGIKIADVNNTAVANN